MRELFDVKPEFISLVEAGANRRTFKIFKSAEDGPGPYSKDAGGQGSRYKELAEKFYKENFIVKFKEYMKDWFANMRKIQEEIDNEEKGGRTMDKEKELEEQKKAKAEEERIKAEKDAKEKKEKVEKEATKVKVAEVVASVLQEKAIREELKGLIEKVEKGEEIKPEEMTKLKEALGVKAEEKPEGEMAKKIEELEAKVKDLENPKGKKKSVEGQDGGQGEKKWPSFSG